MRFVNDYFFDFILTLRALFFFPQKSVRLRVTPGVIIFSCFVNIVLAVLFDLLLKWPIEQMHFWGFVQLFSSFFVLIAVIFLAISMFGQARKFGPILVQFNILSLLAGLVYSLLVYFLSQSEIWNSGSVSVYLFWLLGGHAVFLIFSSIVLFRSSQYHLQIGTGLSMTVAIALLISSAVEDRYFPPSGFFWTDTGFDDHGTYDELVAPIVAEELYSRQDQLLSAQFKKLLPQDPETVELFAVLGAGYAYEGVFRREVEAVPKILDAQFENVQFVSLVNSIEYPDRFPILGKVNLNRVIDEFERRMDVKKDVLLLFLTSHGSYDSFSLRFEHMLLRSLTSTELAAILDGSSIQNIVVVLSACQSGSFVDDLSGDNRLIITASAAEKNSFGCSDENEWTFFGRAFFDHALRQTRDFAQAFEIAKSLVTEWEEEQGFTPSEPQISLGSGIAEALAQLK